MQNFLAVILFLSLGLNAYFIFQSRNAKTTIQSSKIESALDPSSYENAPENSARGEDITQASSAGFSEGYSDSFLEPDNAHNEIQEALKQQALKAYESPQELPAEELFELIQALQSNKQYEELTLPLRAYLKLYPDDYRAWLIEADHILHTEPLSAAIAAYYDLLGKPLPIEEMNKVKGIIQVNTSKVIQQLSGDTSWDLLATFIEPLLQIDPLNRRYIMGLAKAYGMQEQFILMENVLAALAYDDAKAQQLRKSVYQPETSDTEINKQDEISETASLSKRKVTVTGNGEQFFVMTTIHRSRHLLLLDTGASTTAISQRVFKKIPERDKEFVGRFTVQTAGGALEAPLFRLSNIKIGDIVVNNVSVIVLPQDSFTGTFQGLLGMNVLRNFDFRFDPEKQKMTLLER